MSLAGELSQYALSLRYCDLSEHAVHTVKQRLVDSLGCGLGAFAAVPARNARAFAREHPAAASTVLGTTQTTTPDVAAFVNGTMVRYYDFNDAYIGLEGGHPSRTPRATASCPPRWPGTASPDPRPSSRARRGS